MGDDQGEGTPEQAERSKAPDVASAPPGKSGKIVAIVVGLLVVIAAAAFVFLKLWPRAKASRIQAAVLKCMDEAADDAALEKCAKLADDFGAVGSFPGWGAEAAKREAQALASMALISFDRWDGKRQRLAPGAEPPPVPELVKRTLARALDLWAEVLDEPRVLAMWRQLGQPSAERIDAVPGLRSRPEVRRALVRAQMRAGNATRARQFAKVATLTAPQVPATDDELGISEALDEALVLCTVDRGFALKAMAPMLEAMAAPARQARYRAACAAGAGDWVGAGDIMKEARRTLSGPHADVDDLTLVLGELVALVAIAPPGPGPDTVPNALEAAKAALAQPAPTRASGARGKLLAVAGGLALSSDAELARVIAALGEPPDWVYAPPTSPEDLVTMDRAPPVSAELLARAAVNAPPGWQLALHLRAAVEEARLDRVESARAALDAARKLDERSPLVRHLSVMIDALASDPGLAPTNEERDRDREILDAVATELDQLVSEAQQALKSAPNAVNQTRYGIMLLSRAAIALRQDLRNQADQLLDAAWPLLRYLDVGPDGTEARAAYWHGGSGLRSMRAVVALLRADPTELDQVRTASNADRGIANDEATVVDLALALAESRPGDVVQQLSPSLIGQGPSFGSVPARRVLIVRALPKDALNRALTRTDNVPVDRRTWLLMRRVLGGSRGHGAPVPAGDTAIPDILLDLIRL